MDACAKKERAQRFGSYLTGPGNGTGTGAGTSGGNRLVGGVGGCGVVPAAGAGRCGTYRYSCRVPSVQG